MFRLGTTLTTSDKLKERKQEVAAWGQALTPEGDILLYGCNIAADGNGTAFVEKLGSITGADVAASTDATGYHGLGGNWVLEYETGAVETESLFGGYFGYGYLMEDFVSTDENETFQGTDGGDAFIFKDGWGSDVIIDVGGGSNNTVDFSAVTADLIFTFHVDDTLSVTDGENVLNPVDGINTIKAGKGENRFVFERGAFFGGVINASAGDRNILDFSGVIHEIEPVDDGGELNGNEADRTGLDLVVTIHAGGDVSVSADGSAILGATAGMDEVIGGSGDNRFAFNNGATFSGTLDGGLGGSNTLDYSAWTTAVTVTLGSGEEDDYGTATGTSGIINFSNIIGGSGDDVLTGNAYANVIDGGAGNDTIDGVSGHNTLTGGPGDDTFVFSDDWGETTITDGGVGNNTLDFSGVTEDLVFTFHDNGRLTVDDFTNLLEAEGFKGTVTGGSGDNWYAFENGATFDGHIEGGSGGTNTIDFADYKTPVRIDLKEGVVDMGGYLDGEGDMVGMDDDMPLKYLNNGAGVGVASLSEETPLSDLNDGEGVTSPSQITDETTVDSLNNGAGIGLAEGEDLRITLTTGAEVVIDLSGCLTLGDVLAAITGAHDDLSAHIDEKGKGITVTDTAEGEGSLVIADVGDSAAATDLGIAGEGTDGVLAGQTLAHDIRIVLTTEESVDIDIDVADEGTLGDVIDAIHGSDYRIYVTVNDEGNGFDLYDSSDGEGELTLLALNESSSLTDLGLGGETTEGYLAGGVLIHDLRITLSNGDVVVVALGGAQTVGDVLAAINSADNRLNASINDDNNGINISDSAGGDHDLKVENMGASTAATDLGIEKVGESNQLYGNIILSLITSTSFSGIANAIGGAGDDLLISQPGEANVLDGGEGSDTYRFLNNWGNDTVVDYGEEGVDILDFSRVDVDTSLNVTFHDDGTVSVTDGTNTLDSADIIEKIIGGGGDNKYTFEDAAYFQGSIDGGSGSANTLDYSAWTRAVEVNLAEGTATGTTGVENIQNITGGAGDDILVGNSGNNTIIGGDGDDILDGVSGNNTLMGGSGDNTFVIRPQTGTDTIVSTGGMDTLDYSEASSAVTVNLATGAATGTNGVAGSSIHRIIAGSHADSLTGSGSDTTFAIGETWHSDITINGGGGTNTLDLSAVIDPVKVIVESAGLSIALADDSRTLDNTSNIQNIIGSKADDTYYFHDGWGEFTVTSLLDENETRLDFSNVTAALTFNIESDGRVSVQDDNSTDNKMFSSSGVGDLIGGQGTNRFVFEDQGYLNGYIDGGAGGGILDYSAFTTAVSVDLSRMDMVEVREIDGEPEELVLTGNAWGVKGINNIQEVIGGKSDGDVLTGFMADNTWVVSGSNSGTLNGDFAFSGFEYLAGNIDFSDTFTIAADGALAGAIIGQSYGPSTGNDTIEIQGGTYDSVTLTTAGQDGGWIKRDDDFLRFIGIDNVIDESTAVNRTVANAAYRTAQVALAGDPYAVGQEWTITVNDVDYTHEVAHENEVLADVIAAWVGMLHAAGITAVARDNAILVTAPQGQGIAVATDLPDTIISMVDDPADPIVRGVEIRLDRDGDRITVASTNHVFATTFTVVDPTGNFVLEAGGGDDHVTVGAGFTSTANVTIDGQEGDDRITYEVRGIAGTAQTVTHVSDSLLLNGTAIFDYVDVTYEKDVVVFGTDGNDAITLSTSGGNYVLSSAAFGAITLADPGLGGALTIDGADGDDTITVAAGTYETHLAFRGGAGSDTLNLGTGTFNSLTIDADIETVDASDATIRNFAFDAGSLAGGSLTLSQVGGQITLVYGNPSTLTISNPEQSLTLEGDEVTISTALTLSGSDLVVKAKTIIVGSGVTVDTGVLTGTAGAITLEGHHITLEDNSALLALGNTNGEITIEAVDKSALFTPLVSVEINSVSVTVKDDARIEGGDVKITATAQSKELFEHNREGLEGQALDLLKTALGAVEDLAFFATVSYVEATAKIDIQSGSTIVAESFTASAESYADVKAKLTKAWLFGAVAGVAITDAEVTIAGSIEVSGDVLLQSLADNTIEAEAKPAEVKGIAAAVAISVIDSRSIVHVTEDAVLTVGGDLKLEAKTVDRNSTTANSTADKAGAVGIAIVVAVEQGVTRAWLDGEATVTGDVTISAAMEQSKKGVTAQAGVKSKSKGDKPDDEKKEKQKDLVGALLPLLQGKTDGVSDYFKDKLGSGGDKKGDESKELPFDVAGAFAFVYDSNQASARIGNGNGSGTVVVDGNLKVTGKVAAAPAINANSSAEHNDDKKSKTHSDSAFSGSAAIAIGLYHNDAEALINSGVVVDAGGKIHVHAASLSDYNLEWGKNLYDVWVKDADFNTEQEGELTIGKDKMVEVRDNHTGEGDEGTWYKYLGEEDLVLADGAIASYDFSDESLWEGVNPLMHRGKEFVKLLTDDYLGGDVGIPKIGNSWTQATASGDKLAIAGAVIYVDVQSDARAIIASGAQINQNEDTRTGDQDVVVQALNVNEGVHLGGNIELPGIKLDKKKMKLSATYKPKDLLGTKADDGKAAVGATVMIYNYGNTTTALIEDDVALYADSLHVDAEQKTMSVAVGASGGMADNFALNGVVMVNVVNSDTTARIDAGAVIDVGSGLVFDEDDDPPVNGSLIVDARDTTTIVEVAGGIAVSESIGIGATVGVNVVNRSTQAVIGDLSTTEEGDQTAEEDRGTITVAGDVLVRAANNGFIGGFAVAGAVATSSESKPDTGGVTDKGKGTGGTQGSDGSVTGNENLKTWQDKWGAVLKEGVDKGKLDGNIAGGTSDTTKKTGQSKSGFALSGSVVVNVIADDARAYVFNAGTMTVDGDMTVRADNGTGLGSFAGAVAFAKGSGGGSGTAMAGAFGVNVLSGATEAFIDGVSSLDTDDLAVTAHRSGANVAIVAGIGIGTGKKGVGIAGSVGVNIATYTTEAALRDIAGPVETDAVAVRAEDSTSLVAVAGSVAFGGKAGVGIAIGFSWTENEVWAILSGLDDLTHSGDVTIDAVADGLIVAVTGSVGLSLGQEKGYAGAGTVSINFVKNTVEARIIDTTTNDTSTGDIRVGAAESTSIYSFAGAIAAGKTAGLGAAIAVNSMNNDVVALVEGSNLETSGDFRVSARETGTIVTVAVAGAGSGKLAIGGSVSINIFNNDIEVLVKDSTVTAGAVGLAAEDKTVSVAAAGGIAVSTGQGAAGAAIGVNLVFNTVTARVEGSTVTSTTTMDVDALAEELLVSVTLGGAGGAKFALGGSVSANVVMNTVAAEIIEGSTVTAGDDIELRAADTTTAIIVAGGFAGSGKAAVGVSLSQIYMENTMRALIDDSTVISSDGSVILAAGAAPPEEAVDLDRVRLGTYGVTLPENTGASVLNLTVAGAGAGKFGAGVAVSVNVVNNTIEAAVRNGAVVDGHEGVALSAIDSSVINAIALGVAGAGSVAVGGAVSSNVITNTINTVIDGSTVRSGVSDDGTELTNADAAISLTSTSSSIIRSLGLGVSGSGKVAVSVSALGNAVANDVMAAITGESTVLAGGDVMILASDIAPSIIPDLGLDPDRQEALDSALDGSPIAPDGNIVALNVSVAGSGKVAVSVALTGNVVTNSVAAFIDDSTVLAGVCLVTGDVLNGEADLSLAAHSSAGIMALTVGVGASGMVAVQATGFGNVITNSVEAVISGGADVRSGGDMAIIAQDESMIRSLGLSIAASGKVAVSAIVGANVVVNRVEAGIDDSHVETGGALVLDARSETAIFSFAGGVAASGAVGVQVSIAANVIANRTEAFITDSTVTTGGDLTLSSSDTSSIDTIAFGVAGSGAVAVGIALSANVIVNGIATTIDGSTIDAVGSVSLDSESSAIIRAIALGVSGSGAVAVQVTAMGNVIVNSVAARIADSLVEAGGDVLLSASELAPSVIPGWIVPADRMDEFNESLEDSPLDLDANILALNISVAGSGAVAVNGVFTGNVIVNRVTASIDEAATVIADGNVVVASESKAGIISLTVGVGASGAVAVNVTGFGNVIANRVESSIAGNSLVESGGNVTLRAEDSSTIRSLGLSIAGSGAVAVSVIIGANVVANTVSATIDGSAVEADGNLELSAEQKAAIYSFTGGVAASGAVGVQVSLAANVIANTTRAVITGSTIDAGGDVTLLAKDSSSIDAFAFGVAGSGAVAVGVALSANVIANTVTASIDGGSTVTAGGDVNLTAESEAIIRAIALGISGSGAVAVQVTAMGNAVANTVTAAISGSTVTAQGDVALAASDIDIAPSAIPDWIVPADKMDEINDSLEDSPIDLDANILALNLSIAGSGVVAVNGVLSGNVITNRVKAVIDDGSTVKAGYDGEDIINAAAAVALAANSRARIISITAGVGAAGVVGINATGFGNVITNTVESSIRENSLVESGGMLTLDAHDRSSISSIGLSVAGAGAVAVSVIAGANVITNSVSSLVENSTVTTGDDIDMTAENSSSIYGMAGGVAVAAFAGVQLSLTANVITNDTEASIRGSDVNAGGDVTLAAKDTSTIDALAFGVAGGIAGVGAVLTANVITNSVVVAIDGSTVDAGGSVSLHGDSSSVIRALSLGASGGGVAVTVNAMGNTVVNSVEALIEDSTVTAGDDVIVSATEASPGAIPGWIVPADKMAEIDDKTKDSPIEFLDANILALNISLSGGAVAVGVNLTGNVIANTVSATIDNSTVVTDDGDVSLVTDSNSRITSISAGLSVGAAAVGATAFGNVITNTVQSSIGNGSVVHSGGTLALEAGDRSAINSIGLSINIGGVAVGVVVGYNQISNTVAAKIDGSTATSVGNTSMIALSEASMFSFTGGIAAAGAVSVTLSFSVNEVANVITAAIEDSTVVTGGTLSLEARDTSTIDSIAIGVSASGIAAAGAAMSINDIGNTVTAFIDGSDVTVGGNLSLEAASPAFIRSFAAGIAASGTVGGNASVTLNEIGNTIGARIEDSTVNATGNVSLLATDEPPDVIHGFLADMLIPADTIATLTDNLDGEGVQQQSNIVSFAGSIAVAGVAAGSAAVLLSARGCAASSCASCSGFMPGLMFSRRRISAGLRPALTAAWMRRYSPG